MKLEICAPNFQSAINAQQAGANRIELCENLSVGGLTPSFDVIEQVVNALTIPVFVLIRPRSGNFDYTKNEFDKMKQAIETSKEIGCQGVVAGVLTENKMVDIERTKELVELAKPLAFTFHRAFDEVVNPMETVEKLIKIGVNRLLTSGQKESAFLGINLLKELNQFAKERLIIMPGAGIHSQNIDFFIKSGFREIHASATLGKSVSQLQEIQLLSKKIASGD